MKACDHFSLLNFYINYSDKKLSNPMKVCNLNKNVNKANALIHNNIAFLPS